VQPHVLVIDEVGYLQHTEAAANVLYGVIDQRRRGAPRSRPNRVTAKAAIELRRDGAVMPAAAPISYRPLFGSSAGHT
jgi:hypothetical protein